MDKIHENKRTGYTGIANFFIERKPATGSVFPAVTRKVANFNDLLGQIDAKNGDLIDAVKQANAEQKSKFQDSMVTLVCQVKDNLNTMAIDDLKDDNLAKLTAISDSEFAGMRDTEQRDYALRIYNGAVANAKGLLDYGVDDSQISQMKTLIDSFTSMIGKSEGAKPNTAAMRKALYDLFPITDGVLKGLDKAMRGYETKDPEYYNEYLRLRPVKPLGVRHKPKPTNSPQPAATK